MGGTLPSSRLRSDGLLLTTAMIWGFAFVFQRQGMDHVGPYTFNALRFGLGALALSALLRFGPLDGKGPGRLGFPPIAGVLAGLIIFAGAALQQMGLVHTTAGKAGFITGLYVVFVPLIGLILGRRTGRWTWTGALFAAFGLYLLSVRGRFGIAHGDLLVLVGAVFWACHVLLIDRVIGRSNAYRLAIFQYWICAAASLIAALIFEQVSLSGILAAGVPILYTGLLSVTIAYTLQIVAQRRAHPAHAAIILSLESVFAAIGGRFFLGELLSTRALIGCALMLSGMLLTQIAGGGSKT